MDVLGGTGADFAFDERDHFRGYGRESGWFRRGVPGRVAQGLGVGVSRESSDGSDCDPASPTVVGAGSGPGAARMRLTTKAEAANGRAFVGHHHRR
jgi:hypothetical protein